MSVDCIIKWGVRKQPKCCRCGCPLSLENGYTQKSGRGAGRFLAYCKPCAARQQREYFAHPEARKRRNTWARKWRANPANYKKFRAEVVNAFRKRAYGLSPAQFETMRQAQSDKCAVCKEVFDRAPHIDHCHSTGKIRALLCYRCNVGLGFFRDSPQILLSAVKYIKNYKPV